jgi:hypothetical protein
MVLWEREKKKNPGRWSTFYNQCTGTGTRKFVSTYQN